MGNDTSEETRTILDRAAALVADHIDRRRDARVTGDLPEDRLAARLQAYDFHSPLPVDDVTADLLDLLGTAAVRSDHPRYFGLFNPPPLVPAIVGDLVTAAVNPQLAVWGHAPAAAEIERKLVELFARLIWPAGSIAGTFTSGGSEANLTALLSALAVRYPDWAVSGIPKDGPKPTVYCSAEAHLAWIKIARACGLGSDAVRLVDTVDGLSMSGAALAEAIDADADREPVLVVATAGTTAHGAVDDLAGIAGVGRQHDAHVHVDAAWAGGVLVDPDHKSILAGIELADSVTIDPHKWLAVPMGAGLYLARGWQPLATAFGVATGYMPSASIERHDAYIHSLQWSRRFIGGKLFVALATLGLGGYRAIIGRQFMLADCLRQRLIADGWTICNKTSLPLICFTAEGGGDETIRSIEADVVASGKAWLSSVRLSGRLVLRACITSFETDEQDVDMLVTFLADARARLKPLLVE